MEISMEELRKLLQGSPSQSHSFVVGRCYLIRCVTHYHVGRLRSITDFDLVLEDASWIADTGRFHNCLTAGSFNEVEPFVDPVIIPRAVIVDATEWKHNLPSEQK